MSTNAGPGGGDTHAEPAVVPVCPRHPDRESYVRCQRCERPTCPECQRPAAVGIQCVDCVRAQSRGPGRSPRTVFGGAVSISARGQSRPRVTIGLIALCVGVYILQILPGSNVTADFLYAPAATGRQPWRMITSAFLHSPDFALHIVFNMYALWMIGPYLEQLLGGVRYLALYLICAFGGSVGFLLLSSPSDQQRWYGGAVGASGAVFGLFGAFLVVQRRLQRQTGGMFAVIALNFAIGFVPSLGIAWQAHLGGLVTGVVASAVLAYAPRTKRGMLQAAGLVGMTVLLVLITVVKWKLAT